jgi:hypothetical protein
MVSLMDVALPLRSGVSGGLNNFSAKDAKYAKYAKLFLNWWFGVWESYAIKAWVFGRLI